MVFFYELIKIVFAMVEAFIMLSLNTELFVISSNSCNYQHKQANVSNELTLLVSPPQLLERQQKFFIIDNNDTKIQR